MYRLLVIFAILSSTHGHLCQKKPPIWKVPNPSTWKTLNKPSWKYRSLPNEDKSINIASNDFSKIAQKLIEFEESLQTYCKNNGNYSVTEVYGADKYILKYELPEYEKSKINVTSSIQLLTVTAVKVDKDGKKEMFKDVRHLPGILNLEKANWIFESKVLKISIPYKIMIGKVNVVSDCGALNKNITIVPVVTNDNSNIGRNIANGNNKNIFFREPDYRDESNEVDGNINLPRNVY